MVVCGSRKVFVVLFCVICFSVISWKVKRLSPPNFHGPIDQGGPPKCPMEGLRRSPSSLMLPWMLFIGDTCKRRETVTGEVAVDGHFMAWKYLLTVFFFAEFLASLRLIFIHTWELSFQGTSVADLKTAMAKDDPTGATRPEVRWQLWELCGWDEILGPSIRACWGRSIVNLQSDLLPPIAVVVSICIKLSQVVSILLLPSCLSSKWTGQILQSN